MPHGTTHRDQTIRVICPRDCRHSGVSPRSTFGGASWDGIGRCCTSYNVYRLAFPWHQVWKRVFRDRGWRDGRGRGYYQFTPVKKLKATEKVRPKQHKLTPDSNRCWYHQLGLSCWDWFARGILDSHIATRRIQVPLTSQKLTSEKISEFFCRSQQILTPWSAVYTCKNSMLPFGLCMWWCRSRSLKKLTF